MARNLKSVETLARERTDEAFETITDLMECEDPKVRLAAAREILDRGHGKPIGVTVMMPGTSQQRARLAAMSDEQLMEVIDAEFEPLPALPAPTTPAEAPAAKLAEIDADPLFN